MTKHENKIPIKGYATFDPLKHCVIGSAFKPDWFKHLSIYKNDKIMDPLKRIAEETEEDFETLEKILKDAGVKTYRTFLDINKVGGLDNIFQPPVCPRDHFATIGETFYAVGSGAKGYIDIIKSIDKKDTYYGLQWHGKYEKMQVSTAQIVRVGKDLWWDIPKTVPEEVSNTLMERWTDEGFRVHTSHRGYHNDGVFCVVKPGCIISLHDIQNYDKEFPGWDVLYLPDRLWPETSAFTKMKREVGGRWWLKGEEHNAQLIEFVNTWLKEWVGFVEETVFDVNMLSIDQNTVICNSHNKEIADHFKKHKVEPIIFNFRHRYFWDGGIHCITQDLYREGTQEDYFG